MMPSQGGFRAHIASSQPKELTENFRAFLKQGQEAFECGGRTAAPSVETPGFFILYNTQFDLGWLLCCLAFCAFLR